MTNTKKKFVVWTWRRDDGTPAYIGYGSYRAAHPAKALWAKRFDVESPLNDWLRTMDAEPSRENWETEVRFYRAEAQAICAEARRKARREGHKLLSNRPHGTKEGGGAAREILGPDLATYRSVRDAATRVGVNPCTITRWCQSVDSGWSYVN